MSLFEFIRISLGIWWKCFCIRIRYKNTKQKSPIFECVISRFDAFVVQTIVNIWFSCLNKRTIYTSVMRNNLSITVWWLILICPTWSPRWTKWMWDIVYMTHSYVDSQVEEKHLEHSHIYTNSDNRLIAKLIWDLALLLQQFF